MTQEKGPGRNSIASGIMGVESSKRLQVLDHKTYLNLHKDNPNELLEFEDIIQCTTAISFAPIDHPRMLDLKDNMTKRLTCK